MKKKTKKRRGVPKNQPANRKYKDRLFRFAFQDKKDLLELYNAVNGTDYEDPDELTITTLEDVVFLGMKNDLSFIIGSTLNLYEHQSTWNANMPLRGLLYFASLYQIYVKEQEYDLYGGRKIMLPYPQYLVFYNGDREEADQKELLLSDSFLQPEKSADETFPGIECRMRMVNINQGHNRELMEKCRRLWEYSEFIGQVKANLRLGLDISKAINKAMDECQSRGILADILNRCRTEVYDMLLTEYDEQKTKDYIRREEREITAERINKLNLCLFSEGKYEEAKRAATDREYQKRLFAVYGIQSEEEGLEDEQL